MLVALLFSLLHAISSSAFAEDPKLVYDLQDYVAIAEQESPDLQLGVHVISLDDKRAIFSKNAETPLVPASVLKIVTTYTALKILGGSYRFPTEIFLDALPKELGPATEERVDFHVPPKEVGNVYIRGYGDPLFDTHRLEDLVLALARYGVREVRDVVLDDTLFVEPPRATGDKPHEAALSALSLNFNTFSVAIAPGKSGSSAELSLERGAPYTLLNRAKTARGQLTEIEIGVTPGAAAMPPGALDPQRTLFAEKAGAREGGPRVTVQGTIGIRAPGQMFFRAVADPLQYFAALLRERLASNGITVRGQFRRGETPSQAKLLQTIESEELGEIVRELNHFSNNIIAGQLVIAIGQDQSGYFRYDRGLARVRATLEKLGEPAESYEIYDGSGLDKRNRLTAGQVARVLGTVSEDFSVAPEFIASLSRFGQSGTLKTREILDAEYVAQLRGAELDEARRLALSVWGKTGTLDGVSSLAGYAETRTGEHLAFAFILNGLDSKDRGIEIENDLTKLLVGFPVAKLKPKAVPVQRERAIPETRPPAGAPSEGRAPASAGEPKLSGAESVEASPGLSAPSASEYGDRPSAPEKE